MVDTGCSTTIIFQNLVSNDQLERASDVKVTTFGGEVQKCIETVTVFFEVGNVCARDHVLVRPVLDWRETSRFIEAFTRNSDDCAEKLRQLRRMGNSPAIIDLREAYLQLKADKTLWPYKTVIFKSERYYLTRLDFGLNVAPMIMTSVVSAIVEQDDKVKKGTSTYVDNIFVDENVVNREYYRKHFSKYILKSKN